LVLSNGDWRKRIKNYEEKKAQRMVLREKRKLKEIKSVKDKSVKDKRKLRKYERKMKKYKKGMTWI
jgi:Holliday junction resolvasome RuvABC DNA-binding subunit